MYYVYEIYNDITQKRYIGYTKDYKVRFQAHFYDLKNHTHTAEGINKDAIRYGLDHFVFRLLEITEDKFTALRLEREYMIKFKTYVPEFGYNGHDNKPLYKDKQPKNTLTNTYLLHKALENSGISEAFIAKKMKCSRQKVARMFEGADLKVSEILTLCRILHLTDEQRNKIFFAS